MLRRVFLVAAICLPALAGVAWSQALDPAPTDDDASAGSHESNGKWEQRWGSAPSDDGLRLLSPRSIAGALAKQGYSEIDIKRLRGSNYIAEAQTGRGNRVLLVVDGRTSEITGRQVIEWSNPKRNWDEGNGWRPGPWSGPRW